MCAGRRGVDYKSSPSCSRNCHKDKSQEELPQKSGSGWEGFLDIFVSLNLCVIDIVFVYHFMMQTDDEDQFWSDSHGLRIIVKL